MITSLFELRQRILVVLVFFCTLFLLFFYWANPLLHYVLQPLQKTLLPQSHLIATQVTSTVLVPLTLAANTAFLFTTPFALIQLWYFAAPGLYVHEKKLFISAILGSLVLFILGMLFGFFIVLPLLFQFFTQALPNNVQLMPDITSSTSFITHMLWVFGLAFQVPLITTVLVQLRWIQRATLKQIRPYVIVSAFIVGMLLTPPDVLSQITLAVPLCILYELGIWITVFTKSNPAQA